MLTGKGERVNIQNEIRGGNTVDCGDLAMGHVGGTGTLGAISERDRLNRANVLLGSAGASHFRDREANAAVLAVSRGAEAGPFSLGYRCLTTCSLAFASGQKMRFQQRLNVRRRSRRLARRPGAERFSRSSSRIGPFMTSSMSRSRRAT